MPNVVVSDLNFHHNDRILTAATYGRGIWRHKAHEPLPDEAPIPAGANADVGPSAVGLLLDPSKPTPVLMSPPDGSAVASPSGATQLTWNPVDGAIGYFTDIFIDTGVIGQSSIDPETTFAGAQAASWRVWALFPDSRRSPASELRTFRCAM